MITEDEILAWLILHLAPQFGPKSLQKCMQHTTSMHELCQLPSFELKKLGLSPTTIDAILRPDFGKIEQIMTWAAKPQHTLLTLSDPRYPKLLTEISDPPLLLYVDGDSLCLDQPQIAVVGSRQPTALGLAITRHFSIGLCQAGLIITSGLALGIDGASHQAAINNNATTIAVIGTGIDSVYPRQHEKLAAKIRENGAIISEFPLTSRAHANNFPRRNRIISGLSLGVVVVEAAPNSGSLITARLAADQGREVFAVPGAIVNPMAIGCHHLIQQGAKLTSTVAEILAELPINSKINTLPHLLPNTTPANTAKLDNDHRKLIECIGFDVLNFEQLTDKVGFPTQKMSALLCDLILTGYIREELGGYSRVTL